MSKLCVILSHNRAPVGTQQIRFTKGVEQLYYALLFATSPVYKDRPEIWKTWLDIGFHVAVRVPPPATAHDDKLHVAFVSNGKAPEFHGESSNEIVLEKLRGLVLAVEAFRRGARGHGNESRDEAIMGHGRVASDLVKPLLASLQKAALRSDEIEQYLYMVRRALSALTHDDVIETNVSLN